MAITWLETDIVYSSSPKFKRCVGYEETGRNATSVTYKVYLKLKVEGTSSSFFGYAINWSVDGGSTMKIKDASPRWYGNEGYREFSTTITKSASAGGGTTTFSVNITGVSASNPNLSKSYTAKVSTWNTAPTWSSSARLRVRENNSSGAIVAENRDGTENSFKAREDVSAYYVYWDSASDNENNVSKYHLYTQINDGSWTNIYSGSNRYYTHNVGAGNQGTKYDYYVVAEDSYGSKSGSLDTQQFQKNQLTGANLTISNGIWYNDTQMVLTWSGASNTNGNTSFTYSITSSGLTIYNKEKLTTSGGKILILKSGTSTEPYILFEDVKKYVASSSTKTGSFTISLTTRNAYGSTVTKTATANIDIRTNPKAPTSVSVGGKVSTSLGSFLIPSRSNAVISWSGASDYLGGSLTYDVYYKVGTGSEVLATSGTSSTSASIKLPTPTSATEVSFRVVAKTSFGYSATSSTVKDTIHFYNPPTVSIGGYNRTNSSVSLTITNAVSSSISGIAFKKQSYTGNGTTANYTGSKYTATISGLNESSAFTFTATVNDNTGLSSDVSASFKVTPATPKLSVRENGVGVNCVNNGEASLLVKGGVFAVGGYTGTTSYDSMPVGLSTETSGDTNLGFATTYGTTLTVNHSANRQFQLNANNSGNALYFRSAHVNNTGGTGTGWSSWKKVLMDGAIDNLTINTNSNGSEKGLTVTSSAGVVGRIWSGTGGTVFNSIGDYNVHIGRNGSTSDFVIYADKIQMQKHNLIYGDTYYDVSTERRVAFGSGLTPYWGMYGHSTGLGWYDWKNGRSVLNYNPADNYLYLHRTTQINNSLYLESAVSTSNGKHIGVNTSHDSNGYGDGRTHIGYRTSDGKYHHYFRGKGTMNINCTDGTNVTNNLAVSGSISGSKGLSTAHSINIGIHEDTFRSVNCKRLSNGVKYEVRYGVSYNGIKQTSSSSNTNMWGGVIEAYNSDSGSATRRYLFSNTGLYPLNDNASYCGSSSHRWQALYCSTGSVYSSSKDEKDGITSLKPKGRNKTNSTVDTILAGLKEVPLYTYKYRTLNNDDQFVGFLGQELEANNPEFFKLIGSSYDKVIEEPIAEEEDQPTILPLEEKEVKTVRQYDIREASLNGVLMVGLQQALLKIEALENEIEKLKG